MSAPEIIGDEEIENLIIISDINWIAGRHKD